VRKLGTGSTSLLPDGHPDRYEMGASALQSRSVSTPTLPAYPATQATGSRGRGTTRCKPAYRCVEPTDPAPHDL